MGRSNMTALSSVTESFQTTFTLMTEKFHLKWFIHTHRYSYGCSNRFRVPAVTNLTDYCVHTFFDANMPKVMTLQKIEKIKNKKANAFHCFFFVSKSKMVNRFSFHIAPLCPISDNLDLLLLSVPQLFGYYWRARFSEVQLCRKR